MASVFVKCGGSLLDLPDLPARIESLLDRNRLTDVCLLIGGGTAADLVRHWDHKFNLGPQRAHDLAIAAMSFNARMVASLSTRFLWCATVEELGTLPVGSVKVLDPIRIIRQLELNSESPLERTWEITSDSIAAWVASHLKRQRLILLKSTSLRSNDASEFLADDGLVDARFPSFADDLQSIEWCNLRAKNPALETVCNTA